MQNAWRRKGQKQIQNSPEKFLERFVDGTPWAHLDIAGTVWSDKGRGFDPAGATGYGVRTLVNWIVSNATTTAN